MADHPTRLPRSPGARSRGAPLLHTLPGRAIVGGVAVKLTIAATRAVGVELFPAAGLVDSIAGLAIAAGAAYFLVQLFLVAKRRLLWRVRRKLILSYIFIGVVPAILIAAFFVLGALLLFFNFSSYLVQTEIGSLGDRLRLVATRAALEIEAGAGEDPAEVVKRAASRAGAELPGLSLAAVPATCPPEERLASAAPPRLGVPASSAGPWTHVEPPASLPAWIACEDFTGLFAYAHAGAAGESVDTFVRAVAFAGSTAPRYAVVADLPIADALKQRWRRAIGVDIRSASIVDGGAARPLVGRAGSPRDESGAAATAGEMTGVPLSWVTFLDYRDWTTGQEGTLLVSTRLGLADVFARLSAAQGLVGDRPFGQALLLVLLVVVGGLFFVIEVVALAAGLALARSITRSVHELFAGTERVRHGDFSHKIAITARDQLGELAGSFNSMTASIEDLLREAAEKKRLEEELRIAHEIQMSLLPQGPLGVPGLSAAGLCLPAREVGGDYYDFLPLDDHRVGVLIADVSGKGTSAALYMAQLKGLVLSLSAIHPSPRALLVAANRIIARHLDAGSFITMTYAVVDLKAWAMTYARAGHTPLIHVPGSTAAREAEQGGPAAGAGVGLAPCAPPRRAQVLTPDGMVLGLKFDDGQMFERLLEEQTVPLGAGDLFVLFTDGISEAMNVADDCFGEERLGHLAERHAGLSPEELRERILCEVKAFTGGAAQHDDMTMVLLKVEARPSGSAALAEGQRGA